MQIFVYGHKKGRPRGERLSTQIRKMSPGLTEGLVEKKLLNSDSISFLISVGNGKRLEKQFGIYMWLPVISTCGS